jgi:hypothetical protein
MHICFRFELVANLCTNAPVSKLASKQFNKVIIPITSILRESTSLYHGRWRVDLPRLNCPHLNLTCVVGENYRYVNLPQSNIEGLYLNAKTDTRYRLWSNSLHSYIFKYPLLPLARRLDRYTRPRLLLSCLNDYCSLFRLPWKKTTTSSWKFRPKCRH